MKNASKITKTKKSTGFSHSSYLYYNKNEHIEKKYYYKYLKQAN